MKREKKRNKLKYILAKMVNFIIPKNSKMIFWEPHKNSKADKQDIINYAGDSVLSFLNYISNKHFLEEHISLLVIYDKERLEDIKKYLNTNKISNIVIVKHFSCYTGFSKILHKVQYEIFKMRSKIWICATLYDNKRYAISTQKLVCLGYFASFKSDYNDVEFDYLPKNWSLICSTSMFDSITKSAAFAIPYKCFVPLGLPRNDYLFSLPSKKDKINDWIYRKTGKKYSKIIIYAPTFRDYEASVEEKHSIWGYSKSDDVSRVLKDHNAIVIAKLHSWQNVNAIDEKSDSVIFYEPNFDFTIYDVMTVADVLISDYSSIGLDFMLLEKPVIYNLYDREKYMLTRGMCLEPIEYLFGGEIAISENELANSIVNCLNGKINEDKVKLVRNLFFKYQDGNSCKRVYEYLMEKGVF